MCFTVCGEFIPNLGVIAGYVDEIWDEFSTKWGVQIEGMNFKARSSIMMDVTGVSREGEVRCLAIKN